MSLTFSLIRPCHPAKLSQSEAFAYLVRQSSTQNQKLRVVAKDLVKDTERISQEARMGVAA